MIKAFVREHTPLAADQFAKPGDRSPSHCVHGAHSPDLVITFCDVGLIDTHKEVQVRTPCATTIQRLA